MPPSDRTPQRTATLDKILPLLLFGLFLLVSIPGVKWGTPEIWNPDELVARVALALNGELQFDETEPDYNYPSLPKYVMYGLGSIVYGLGYGRLEFIVAARVLSALIGGIAVVLVYLLSRTVGGTTAGAAFAAFLVIASGVVPENARFAHNDMYLLLFAVLCLVTIVKYQLTRRRLWLYASFLCVGLAASSKYTGGSLLLLPLAVEYVLNWRDARRDWLAALERGALGGLLALLGFVAGTPKALLWMSFYFKRVLPALLRYPQYGLAPNSQRGIFGQWGTFQQAVGAFLYYLFLLAVLWALIRLVQHARGNRPLPAGRAEVLTILLLALVIFDLPFLVSVNYIPRYFIPFVPIFAVLTGLALEDLRALSVGRVKPLVAWAAAAVFLIGLGYSLARVFSTMLLFTNDARGPASEYVRTLQPGTVIEYTLYPPIIARQRFVKARNYPIFFLKYPGDTVPTDKPYDYNSGEAGLLERGVDYLVIDSLTYGRFFQDEYVCQSNPVECEFFHALLAGETEYQLLETFEYRLPPYLPQLRLSAVNPSVSVYERRR